MLPCPNDHPILMQLSASRTCAVELSRTFLSHSDQCSLEDDVFLQSFETLEFAHPFFCHTTFSLQALKSLLSCRFLYIYQVDLSLLCFLFTYETKSFVEFDIPLLDIVIEVRIVLSKLLDFFIQRCDSILKIFFKSLRFELADHQSSPLFLPFWIFQDIF